MKRTAQVLLVWGILLLFPCLLLAQRENLSLSITNPLNETRKSETIEIAWRDLLAALPSLNPRTAAAFEGGNALVSQSLDLGGDGSEDLFLFQSDFEPGQTKLFVVMNRKETGTSLSPVDVRFVLPRQDMAWESDRIAYRMYGSLLAGDVNNGIDVWTKRVRYPIVAKWYRANEGNTSGKDTYHEDHGEGADFFSVGRSLGAGSCAILRDTRLWQPGLFSSHRVIATGPVRAMFEVSYDSGMIDGKRYREVKRISLDAGHNLNKIEVRYTGFGPHDTLIVASGIVKRKAVRSYSDSQAGWISLWGPTNDDSTNGFLGTGIVMPRGSLRGIREDSQHLLILGSTRNDEPLIYFAGAGWTRSDDFATADDWNDCVRQCARRQEFPLAIRFAGSSR
jgi:pectinesterase